MKKILLLLVCIIIFNSPSGAVDITITEAEQMALHHSFELKKAKTESEAYRSNLSAARAERYPNLSIKATALYNSDISTFDINLPGVSFQRDIGLHEIYQTDLKISIPIYTGGKIASAVNLAEANFEIKKALLQKSSDDIRFMAKQEYLKLYKADKLVDAAHSSLKRTELVRKNIQSLYDAGAADSVDLIEVEFAYNNAALAFEQSNNNRHRQEIVFSILLGLDIDEPIHISSLPQTPESLNKEIVHDIDENKPELMVSRSMIAVSKSLLKLNKASYAPNLNLFGGYSYGKPNISPFEEDFNDNYTIGAVLNWSLNLGGKTKSKMSMAKYQLESSRHEYDRIYEQIQKQAQLAYESLKLAFSSYTTALKNYEISKSNFRLAQIKNHEGVMSSNHLLDIETNLSQAESMLYSSEADYHIILNQYNYLIGYEKLKEGK